LAGLTFFFGFKGHKGRGFFQNSPFLKPFFWGIGLKWGKTGKK